MPASVAFLRHRRPVDYGTAPGSTTISRRGRDLLRRFANVVQGALGGSGDGAYVIATTGTTEPTFANAGLSASSATGTVTTTINGVAVAQPVGGSDTLTCGLVAAAINASTNALVQGFVTASNLTATLTLTSVAAGDTVDVCGYRFIATSGVTPSTVSGQNLFAFDITGNDAADATALAAAINAAPGLQRYVMAIPVSNVVRLFARSAAWPTAPGTPLNFLLSQATTIVASASTLAAGAFVGISACYPGVQANAFTIAVAATGGTVAVLNTETRLNRGLGFGVVPVSDAA